MKLIEKIKQMNTRELAKFLLRRRNFDGIKFYETLDYKYVYSKDVAIDVNVRILESDK